MTDNAYADAQQAQQLRHHITAATSGAVRYGNVDRAWANTWLHRLGANPVTGNATYQLNVPITGLLGMTINAEDRTQAVEKFKAFLDLNITRGIVDGQHCVRVFQPEVVVGAEPQFYSGPLDVVADSDEPVELTLDELKASIRKMLMEGVTEHGWGYSYAVNTVEMLGLEPLPTLHNKTVEVPVSGTAKVSVPVFDDADDDAVQRIAQAKMAAAKDVTVKPEEIGQATWARSSGEQMGLHLVDDDNA